MRVIEYLLSARKHLKEQEDLGERITRLSAQCEKTMARELDGMPHGHGGGSSGDELIAALADLKTQYDKKASESVAAFIQVDSFISRIEKEPYRDILYAIYIDGESLKSLPSRMRRSSEWCRYTRKNALKAAEKLYGELYSEQAE